MGSPNKRVSCDISALQSSTFYALLRRSIIPFHKSVLTSLQDQSPDAVSWLSADDVGLKDAMGLSNLKQSRRPISASSIIAQIGLSAFGMSTKDWDLNRRLQAIGCRRCCFVCVCLTKRGLAEERQKSKAGGEEIAVFEQNSLLELGRASDWL